jgi:aminocarboxymuconate-semialdehyde decarboxylase
MLKIDMHSHILPRTWPDLNEKFGVSGFPCIKHENGRAQIYKDGRFFREVKPNAWDPELRIEEYRRYGVAVHVVCTVPVMFSYWAKPQHALELARYLNDHIAQVCQSHPRNILGLGTVPLQSPELAIREMERCLKELGLAGLQIGSHVNEWNLSAPELSPFFAAAQDLDVALLIHPWDMMGSSAMSKYWLPWLVGMPAELSRAICSLIFGGVLERLPRLRVCFSHGGGAFPFTIGRIEQGFKMRPDLVAIDNAVNPREYLHRIYVDTITHDPKALRYLIEVLDPNKVMLGTDYPFPLGEERPGAVIEALDLPLETQQRLYHGAALEWLGLEQADSSL